MRPAATRRARASSGALLVTRCGADQPGALYAISLTGGVAHAADGFSCRVARGA